MCRGARAFDDCSGIETAPWVRWAGCGRGRWEETGSVTGRFRLAGSAQRGHGWVVVTVHSFLFETSSTLSDRAGWSKEGKVEELCWFQDATFRRTSGWENPFVFSYGRGKRLSRRDGTEGQQETKATNGTQVELLVTPSSSGKGASSGGVGCRSPRAAGGHGKRLEGTESSRGWETVTR